MYHNAVFKNDFKIRLHDLVLIINETNIKYAKQQMSKNIIYCKIIYVNLPLLLQFDEDVSAHTSFLRVHILHHNKSLKIAGINNFNYNIRLMEKEVKNGAAVGWSVFN